MLVLKVEGKTVLVAASSKGSKAAAAADEEAKGCAGACEANGVSGKPKPLLLSKGEEGNKAEQGLLVVLLLLETS